MILKNEQRLNLKGNRTTTDFDKLYKWAEENLIKFH